MFFAVVAFAVMHEAQAGTSLGVLLLPAILFTTVLIAANAAFGVYTPGTPGQFSSIVPRLLCAVFIALLVSYATLVNIHPMPWILDDALIAGGVVGVLGSLLVRAVVMPSLTSGLVRHRVIVIGTGKRAASAEGALRNANARTVEIVGFHSHAVQRSARSRRQPRHHRE